MSHPAWWKLHKWSWRWLERQWATEWKWWHEPREPEWFMGKSWLLTETWRNHGFTNTMLDYWPMGFLQRFLKLMGYWKCLGYLCLDVNLSSCITVKRYVWIVWICPSKQKQGNGWLATLARVMNLIKMFFEAKAESTGMSRTCSNVFATWTSI